MLKPAKQISVRAWMKAPETVAVVNALGTGKACFVGGCVRNAVLGLDTGDIDIATQWTPDQAAERLKAVGIKVVPTGIDHGTVTAVVNHKPFQITTLRRDVETDGRRAVVAFSTDWLEDALRRDFTLNTLLADTDGHIYDPTGQGLADLEAGRVVFVGDPAQRIAEDYLRILRFFRFYAFYGKGVPDPAALAACRAAADKMSVLSRERVTQEFLKILGSDRSADALRLIADNGILPDLVNSDTDWSAFERLCRMQEACRMIDAIARFCVLGRMDSARLALMERELVLSGQQKKLTVAILQVFQQIKSGDEREIRVLIYRHGREAALQAVLVFFATDEENEGLGVIKSLQSWVPPAFPLTGEDVKASGVAEGPEVGRMLAIVENWWIGLDFKPKREECLEKLRAVHQR